MAVLLIALDLQGYRDPHQVQGSVCAGRVHWWFPCLGDFPGERNDHGCFDSIGNGGDLLRPGDLHTRGYRHVAIIEASSAVTIIPVPP
jgi:hypothetical protein